MAKNTYVLRALKILGLEEILNLAQAQGAKQVPLKQAAGGELIVWDDDDPVAPKKPQNGPDAKILEFPKKKTVEDMTSLEETPKESPEGVEEGASFVTSDIVLWQREMSRQTEDQIHKLNAFKGYKKATEVYAVKRTGPQGKVETHFASTNGVLVNKKQA